MGNADFLGSYTVFLLPAAIFLFLRSRSYSHALLPALTDPGAVLEFLRRLPMSLPYRLAAWRWGGYWD